MFDKKSVLNNSWELKKIDERLEIFFTQKFKIPNLLSKLLILRNVDELNVETFLNPDIKYDLPDPFLLYDMEKAILRVIDAINNNEFIGILADYDVDGSTSAGILYNFLKHFNSNIILKIPNRLTEGYGPNERIMDEMLNENISLIFTLDCGTTSSDIFEKNKYKNLDIIVIDHHLSLSNLPKVHSIINPNRYDEKNNFNQMAAVGVTFLFLMGLRNIMRKKNYFNNIKEPNLLNYLDLVALGTICDVVELKNYNRSIVKKGLEVIKKRKNKAISKILDNSKINTTPSSKDLAFLVGPQLNSASRIDDSTLPSKLLIENDVNKVENITRKLYLLNEKRKLIENQVYKKAIIQVDKQKDLNYFIIFGENWHNGVLGIIASRIVSEYKKPSIVISFTNNLGVGSARSIQNIDLGNIILNAKNLEILESGGGHSMAAGLKIKYENLQKFQNFLNNEFSKFNKEIFKKIDYFDTYLSVNQLNDGLLDIIDKIEPFGSGNSEPKFIIKDIKINNIKILKEKHILFFFNNDLGNKFKGISFNTIGTELGDYLINYKKYNLFFACTIKKDNFADANKIQIVITDAMIAN